jgi:hypothetical protein
VLCKKCKFKDFNAKFEKFSSIINNNLNTSTNILLIANLDLIKKKASLANGINEKINYQNLKAGMVNSRSNLIHLDGCQKLSIH